jgi:hypothetical protein
LSPHCRTFNIDRALRDVAARGARRWRSPAATTLIFRNRPLHYSGILPLITRCGWPLGHGRGQKNVPPASRFGIVISGRPLSKVIIVAWLLLLPLLAPADFLSFMSVADTSLLGFDPASNNGLEPAIIAGNNMHGLTNRGLLRFDLSRVPPGSTVTRADLFLEVTGVPTDGYAPALYRVHRVLSPWGEGTGKGGGSRAPAASANEATWNAAFAFVTNWTAPGGDFSPVLSAEEPIAAINQYQFSSTLHTQLLADTQFWIEHPAQNFGWLLKDATEESTGTARRFGSREETGYEPRLDIDFIAPVRIGGARRTANGIQFSFNAEPGFAYAVERATALSNTNVWTLITNVPGVDEPLALEIVDAFASTNSFYRVRRND